MMRPSRLSRSVAVLVSAAAVAMVGGPAVAAPQGDDSRRVLSVDHYVRVRSSVPAIAGETAQIYVRERVAAGTIGRGLSLAGRVVVFVHGAGTPGSVAFDVPYGDYSWMTYLAEAGFDVFSLDFTGYGRSTRPHPMNDPCNLSAEQQATLVPASLTAPCAASYPKQLGTIGADWDDLAAVVDYVRALRHVDRVHFVGWSQGAPRSGGFAARHPDRVDRIVWLAPAYNRAAPAEPPAVLPADGVAMNKQSRDDFVANWERQVGCTDQFEPAVRDAVWAAMLASDPVGRTWGTGVRRAPSTTVWGWNAAAAAKVQAPVLLVSGVHDRQVVPGRIRDLHEDLGSRDKVFIDLACSSHNAQWERQHLLLFGAALDWLSHGSVNGIRTGTVRLGYEVP